MPFLVTDSAVPLPAETLPALKLTHHYDVPTRGEVYAYLRCYVHKGALCYNLLVFDEAPPPTARIGFALCPAESEGEFLFASFGRAPDSDALPDAAGRRLRRRAGLFCPGGKAQRRRGRAGPILVCRGRAARAGAV